jgi:phage terminase small subunit
VPRNRNPKREEAFQIWKQSKGKMLLKDIASQLGVLETQIRKWKSQDKWEQKAKGTSPKVKGNVTKQEKQPKVEKISENIESLIEPLNDQQRLFSEVYADNHNATQAYLRAYQCDYRTANVCGPRLLVNASVRAYVQELKRIKREAMMLEPDDIVDRYMRIAFADMSDFVDYGTHVIPLKDAQGKVTGTLNKDFLRFYDSRLVDGGIIKEVKQTQQGMSIKLESRDKALEWLSNYFEMNPQDKHKKAYDDARLAIERDKLELDKKAIEAKNPPEEQTQDDGFLAALEGKASEVWSDDENEDV